MTVHLCVTVHLRVCVRAVTESRRQETRSDPGRVALGPFWPCSLALLLGLTCAESDAVYQTIRPRPQTLQLAGLRTDGEQGRWTHTHAPCDCDMVASLRASAFAGWDSLQGLVVLLHVLNMACCLPVLGRAGVQAWHHRITRARQGSHKMGPDDHHRFLHGAHCVPD